MKYKENQEDLKYEIDGVVKQANSKKELFLMLAEEMQKRVTEEDIHSFNKAMETLEEPDVLDEATIAEFKEKYERRKREFDGKMSLELS